MALPLTADPQLASIAQVIQLSVAPVFLLTGIGAILNVTMQRLSRIIDRARELERQFPQASPRQAEALRRNLKRLAKRARLTGWGIAFCAGSALLVSSVIVALFVGTLAALNLSVPIAVLFIGAVVSLILALYCVLREVYLATRHLRIGEPEPDPVPAPPQKPAA